MGAGMSARGAIELVVLSIAHEAGLFAQGDPGPRCEGKDGPSGCSEFRAGKRR